MRGRPSEAEAARRRSRERRKARERVCVRERTRNIEAGARWLPAVGKRIKVKGEKGNKREKI